MLEWVSFYSDFLFDALYSWQVPGLNISFLFLFISVAFLSVFLRIVIRTLIASSNSSNAKSSKSSKGSKKSSKGGGG